MLAVLLMRHRCFGFNLQKNPFSDLNQFRIILFDDVRMAGLAVRKNASFLTNPFRFSFRHSFNFSKQYIALLRVEFDYGVHFFVFVM